MNPKKSMIMRNTLFVIGLSVLVVSCGSRTPVKNNQTKPTANNISVTTKPAVPPKPAVKHDGGYNFYRVNIADPTKNDKTCRSPKTSSKA